MDFIAMDIAEETINNTDYRRVISTTKEMQLVLMSLEPGERIPLEIHPKTTQFIRVEEGYGKANLLDPNYVQQITRNRYTGKSVYPSHQFDVIPLYPNVALFIPAEIYYEIINDGDIPLKFYTLFAPTEHAHNLIQEEQPKREAFNSNSPFKRSQSFVSSIKSTY